MYQVWLAEPRVMMEVGSTSENKNPFELVVQQFLFRESKCQFPIETPCSASSNQGSLRLVICRFQVAGTAAAMSSATFSQASLLESKAASSSSTHRAGPNDRECSAAKISKSASTSEPPMSPARGQAGSRIAIRPITVPPMLD